MPFEAIFFYGLAILVLVTALTVILAANPIYSAMSLVMCFFGLAGVYVLLHAHFIAAAQILVYAGAIMVLFLFVIMLMNPEPDDLRLGSRFKMKTIGWLLGGLFFVTVSSAVLCLFKSDELLLKNDVAENFGSIEQVGKALFTTYMYPFEAAGVLLLVGIVGVVVLSRVGKKEKKI